MIKEHKIGTPSDDAISEMQEDDYQNYTIVTLAKYCYYCSKLLDLLSKHSIWDNSYSY